MGCHTGSLGPCSHWRPPTQGNGLQYCSDRRSEPREPRMLMSRVICAHLSLWLMLRFPRCSTIFTGSYCSFASPSGPCMTAQWQEGRCGEISAAVFVVLFKTRMPEKGFKLGGKIAFSQICYDCCWRTAEGRRDLPLKWKQVKNWEKKSTCSVQSTCKTLEFPQILGKKATKSDTVRNVQNKQSINDKR